MNAFEQKINDQVNLTKIGIYEVFVNQKELSDYWELTFTGNPNQMQKVYAVVFDGTVNHLSFERGRAIRNLLDEAGVDSLSELEAL